MRHLIVGQVEIKIITSITGGIKPVEENMPQPRWKGQFCRLNKINLTNLPILLSTLSML